MLGGIGFLVVLYLVCAELLKRVAVAPIAAAIADSKTLGLPALKT